MNYPDLKISDGTADGTVDLLALKGWLLKDWKPSVPEAKGGGTFRNSPFLDGKHLAYRKFDNVTDTFNLVGSQGDQDEMIETIQKLQRLLEKALSYWITQWQAEPVWIEARAPKETKTRYATIIDYRFTGFGGPFQQPFFSSDCNSATEAILVIEHTLWQETRPGEEGICVELKNITEYPAYADYASGTYAPNASGSDCTYSPDLKVPDLTGASLIAGYNPPSYPGNCEIGIVFDNVTVPVGATLIKATLHFHENSFVTAPAATLHIDGQYQGRGVINSVTLTNGGTGYRNPRVVVNTEIANPPYAAFSRAANIQAVVNSAGVITELNIIDGGEGYYNPTISIIDFTRQGGENATATATATPLNHDATVFDGTSADFLDRERTDAFVNLDVLEDVSLPSNIDVTAIVSEILSNSYWTSGDDLALFISQYKGEGYRSIKSFDNGSSYPELLLEWTTDVQPVGRNTTCAAEVFVTNKASKGVVNFVFCYDASEGTFSGNLIGWDFASNMPIFQDAAKAPITPAVGDIIYFGSCPLSATDTNYGPFSNLIFDLYSVAVGIEGIWEYGSAWTDFDVSGGAYNQLCGNQSSFQTEGVGSIVFEQPDDWDKSQVVDGTYDKTGYWARFRVTSVSTPTTPYQWHRDIYAATTPYIDINADKVPGDIPALARVVFEAAACQLRSMNTLVLGLRSLSRGGNFNAYLNASDVQDVMGIVFARETINLSHHMQDASEAPTGRALDLTGFAPIAGANEDSFIEVCSWTISGTTATEYLGIYHAYARGYYAASGMKVRLRVVFGEEHNVFYSEVGSTYYLAGAITAIDLGQLAIMPSSLIHPDETVEKITIYLEMLSTSDGYYNLSKIYDIVLIPCDEWAGNFGMPKTTATAVLQYGQGLDVDGITAPRNYRAVQTKKGIGKTNPKIFSADWSRIASGEPIFQQNADQRLWFMQFFQTYSQITNFETMGGVRAERSARYLLARGGR